MKIIMKGFLLICMITTCTMGCSKNEEQTNQNDELAGSRWSQKVDEYQSHTFAFGSDNKYTWMWKTGIGDSGPITSSGKFEYVVPNITIFRIGGGVLFTGVVNNDKMILKSANPDIEDIELTKRW